MPEQLPDIFEPAPILCSHSAGWQNVSLEFHCLPAGETPEFSLNHHVVSISMGTKLEVEQTVEGKNHQATVFPGMVFICPIHSPHSFCWNDELQPLTLNLNQSLFDQNAIDLLGTACTELTPQFAIQDELIQQLGLALQAELKSQGSNSRLYAETLANTLAVHLLRHYSTQGHQIINCKGDLPQHKLRLVLDYINDYLEDELRLQELAAIVQLSQYHFCRSFKQAMGVSPYQYVIQQRVERAKRLLQQGEMTLGSVAIACGFAHQSHLNRHFKRLTGVAPRAWLNS